jgi:hypothetical protein
MLKSKLMVGIPNNPLEPLVWILVGVVMKHLKQH